MTGPAEMKEGLQRLRNKAKLAKPRPGMLKGVGIAWGPAGYAELVETEVPRPQATEVTVRVEASMVSPGTERAQYLRLPNTSQAAPPGYSVAGTVLAAGPAVTGIARGDRVAAYGVPHTSVANVDAADTYPIPDGVSSSAAALTHLGVIAQQGVDKCRLGAEGALGVVGTGPIGALALRLALSAGAREATVIARSRAREALARRGGASAFLTSGAGDDRLAELSLPVVIEAAGTPEALRIAVAAAADDARVVLLGSPRGPIASFPYDIVRDQRLELIGAHVGTLDLARAGDGEQPRRRLALQFLQSLASGLDVDDLVGEAVDPREPEAFYRRLASDEGPVAAFFDWSRLPDDERIGRAPLFHVPYRLRSRAPATASVSIAEPFGGAEGMLRLGICGCGEIAVANAAGAASAPNVGLSACYDPQPALAEQLANEFGGVACPTFEALLGRDDVDAVLLCVPHHLHAPLAIEAAQAGKHVVVEKPPASELAGAAEMVAAAEDAGVVLSVCFPHRYEPRVVAARELIRGGALGEPEGAAIKHFLDKSLAYWLGGYSGRSRSDWRKSRERAGGGILIMNVSHYLDLLRHLTELEVHELAAFTKGGADAGEVEEIASVTLQLSNGGVGAVIGGSAVRGELTTEFRLWGSEGHLTIEPDARVFTLRALDGVRAAKWQAFGDLPGYDMRAAYLSRLGTAIACGEAPDIGGADALAVQAVIEAAYRSSESSAVVRPADLLAEVRA